MNLLGPIYPFGLKLFLLEVDSEPLYADGPDAEALSSA
jgi:hypothetical protein